MSLLGEMCLATNRRKDSAPIPKCLATCRKDIPCFRRAKADSALPVTQFSAGLELDPFLLGQPMNRGSGCPQAVGDLAQGYPRFVHQLHRLIPLRRGEAGRGRGRNMPFAE